GLQKPEKAEPEALATLLKFYKDKALKADGANMMGQNSLSIASDVLAQSGDATARQALANNLKSDDPKTRLLAAQALAQWCHDEAAIDSLLEIIKGNGPQRDRQSAQYSLQMASQDPKVSDAVKTKIKATFDEVNQKAQKPQKPPSPPSNSDF